MEEIAFFSFWVMQDLDREKSRPIQRLVFHLWHRASSSNEFALFSQCCTRKYLTFVKMSGII